MAAQNSPDMELISELYETIERQPQATSPREILIELWSQAGWHGEAEPVAEELCRMDSSNIVATRYLDSRKKVVASASSPAKSQAPKKKATSSPKKSKPTSRPEGVASISQDPSANRLSEAYNSLTSRSGELLDDYLRVQAALANVKKDEASGIEPEGLKNLSLLAKGQIELVVGTRLPKSARALARLMQSQADKSGALDVAVEDLIDYERWFRRGQIDDDDDQVREAILKRINALEAALPDDVCRYASLAMMHVEHEVLHRSYTNDTTMLTMDSVAIIPRDKFWVSEDGYAWDMEELASALAANSGVMRNPLSREMFSADDVRTIMEHPSCSELSSMRLAQDKFFSGIRSATIGRLEALAAALLADQSTDQAASRKALDEFLSFVAALPGAEQTAMDKLRVPATDSHSGIAFDCSIGEAVKDAQANKVCLHKTGDFLTQAARHLRTLS